MTEQTRTACPCKSCQMTRAMFPRNLELYDKHKYDYLHAEIVDSGEFSQVDDCTCSACRTFRVHGSVEPYIRWRDSEADDIPPWETTEAVPIE